MRNQVCKSIHDFFQEQGFLYIHTPIITASDCEGAGEMFRVTTLDLGKLPRNETATSTITQGLLRQADVPDRQRPACRPRSSPAALGKVYTFGPTFRAENSNTSRHLAEFWMVEPEMAFYELNDNMDLAEAFLKRIISDVLDRCAEDMKFFAGAHRQGGLRPAGERRSNNPFVRLPYTEAVDILQKSGKTFEFPVAWGIDLQSEHERYLTEKHFKCPVILYDYPRTLKPFYMRVNDDGKTVRAMDVLVPGVGEIIGGSQREERLDVLEAAHEGAGPRPGRLLVVSRPAPLRHGAARRLRPGPGAHDAVPDRHGQHPRRDSVPANARATRSSEPPLAGSRRRCRAASKMSRRQPDDVSGRSPP